MPTQPAEYVLNAEHPLADGLVCAYVADPGTGNFVDLLDNGPDLAPTTEDATVGTVTLGEDSYVAGKAYTEGAGWTAVVAASALKITGDKTLVVVHIPRGNGSNTVGYPFLFAVSYDEDFATNPWYGYGIIRQQLTNAECYCNISGAVGSRRTLSPVGLAQNYNTLVVQAFTFRSGSQIHYINGSPVRSAANTGSTGYATTSTVQIGSADEASKINDDILLVLVYNKELDGTAIAALASDPWAMFRAPPPPLATPTNLDAEVAGPLVHLTWDAQPDVATGYLVYRSDSPGGTYTLVGTVTRAEYFEAPGHGRRWYYKVSATDGETETDPTDPIEVVPGLPDGWTPRLASISTRIVYLDPDGGDDGHDGLSEATPKQTWAAAVALLRDGFPDWLLIKRGTTIDFAGAIPNWTLSGRGRYEEMVIGAYGEGERPQLLTGSGNGIYAPTVKHLVISDIHLKPDDYDGSGAGIHGIVLFGGAHDVLIEGVLIEGYHNNLTIQNFEGTPERITVRRSVIYHAHTTEDSHSQGMFAGGVHGLQIVECVYDHNGWSETVDGADPNMFRHNMYIHPESANVLTLGNVVARPSHIGISQQPGGVNIYNLFIQCPIAIAFDDTGDGDAPGKAIRWCVALGSRDTNDSTPQGFGFALNPITGYEIRDNIIAHNTVSTGNIAGINVSGGCDDLTIADNIIYNWRGSGSGWTAAPAMQITGAGTTVTVSGNDLQQPNGGYMVAFVPPSADGFAFAGNRYYTTNTPPHVFTTNTNYLAWITFTGEVGSAEIEVAYPDATRDIAAYMDSLGETATVEAFLERARAQRRGDWDTRWTSYAVINDIRAHFGKIPIGSPADLSATVVDDGEVKLEWSLTAEGTYNIYRSVDGGPYLLIAEGYTGSDPTVTYNDTGLVAGEYNYRVASVTPEGHEHVACEPETVEVMASGTPTLGSATVESDGLTIVLKWSQPVSPGTFAGTVTPQGRSPIALTDPQAGESAEEIKATLASPVYAGETCTLDLDAEAVVGVATELGNAAVEGFPVENNSTAPAPTPGTGGGLGWRGRGRGRARSQGT